MKVKILKGIRVPGSVLWLNPGESIQVKKNAFWLKMIRQNIVEEQKVSTNKKEVETDKKNRNVKSSFKEVK